MPSPAAKLPALQLIGATEPATQEAPIGQLMQADASCAPLAFEKEPAAHGSGSPVPSGQYAPEGQAMHSVGGKGGGADGRGGDGGGEMGG